MSKEEEDPPELVVVSSNTKRTFPLMYPCPRCGSWVGEELDEEGKEATGHFGACHLCRLLGASGWSAVPLKE